MSDMWSVEVVNRGERWVDLCVRQRHPDAGAMPEDKQFALSLLLNEAYGYDDKWQRRATSPLGEQFPIDRYWDAEVVAQRQDEFIESVRIYRQVNAPFNEKAAHAAVDRKVLEKGIERDGDDWEDEWTSEWNAWWAADDGPPIATYRIVVTDPRWLAHLTLGQSFDSAAYCLSGERLGENRDEAPPLPADARARPGLSDFPMAQVPRGERSMNPELIAGLAASSEPLAGAGLAAAVAAHREFLASGGRGGAWQLLSVSGMPLCIYTGARGASGEQLVLRHKTIAAGSELGGQELAHADLSGSVCRGVRFAGATISDCAAIDAFFDDADFSQAVLRGTDFSGSSLQRCSFRGADLRGADFEHTDCTGADFTGAKLEGARFPGAILEGVRR